MNIGDNIFMLIDCHLSLPDYWQRFRALDQELK